MPDDAWKQEAAEAQANGIFYTNVPMRGLGRPAIFLDRVHIERVGQDQTLIAELLAQQARQHGPGQRCRQILPRLDCR